MTETPIKIPKWLSARVYNLNLVPDAGGYDEMRHYSKLFRSWNSALEPDWDSYYQSYLHRYTELRMKPIQPVTKYVLADSVQERFKINKNKPRKRKENYYLLTGHCTCGLCGAAYVGGYRTKNRYGTVYYGYQCRTRKNNTKSCKNRYIRKEKLEKEIKDLYIKDQVNKINLMIYGPPILNDSPFLLDEVNEYNKGEFEKKYGYGNYQDKGLPKNKELNISPQPYIRKEPLKIVDINEYLKNLREGVGL